MATTMYLRNQSELAAAAKVLRRHGLRASAAELREQDRYVMNIAARYAGADAALAAQVARQIELAVARIREERNALRMGR